MPTESSGIHRYVFRDGTAHVLLHGRVVGAGSPEAMEAVARLFGLEGKIACVTPNGRTDGHGTYVSFRDGKTVCAFCEQPL